MKECFNLLENYAKILPVVESTNHINFMKIVWIGKKSIFTTQRFAYIPIRGDFVPEIQGAAWDPPLAAPADAGAQSAQPTSNCSAADARTSLQG